MSLTVLTALATGPPRSGELALALRTLPASVAGGAAVLMHNVALTQVGTMGEKLGKNLGEPMGKCSQMMFLWKKHGKNKPWEHDGTLTFCGKTMFYGKK